MNRRFSFLLPVGGLGLAWLIIGCLVSNAEAQNDSGNTDNSNNSNHAHHNSHHANHSDNTNHTGDGYNRQQRRGRRRHYGRCQWRVADANVHGSARPVDVATHVGGAGPTESESGHRQPAAKSFAEPIGSRAEEAARRRLEADRRNEIPRGADSRAVRVLLSGDKRHRDRRPGRRLGRRFNGSRARHQIVATRRAARRLGRRAASVSAGRHQGHGDQLLDRSDQRRLAEYASVPP